MVRSTFAGFSTALSALQANQKRLDIVGQNLSNMNTPGYTRQELKTSSLNYTSPVSKYMNGTEIIVGFGVHMDKVAQIRDPYLDIQYRDQMQKSGYTDGLQTALDRLAKVFDESNITGIKGAFDDIYSHLINMQDVSKVNDAIYETELRTRIKALTNLLNEADRQITESERQEYMTLDGRDSSENGSVEQVNDILQRVGNLNRQIKQNQILGQQSLELMDERNLLLDELASYIPIEVSYYKDLDHDGIDNTDPTKENLSETYHLDSNGNPMFKKDWPDDLRVEMLYTDENGVTQKLTLIEGTEGSGHDNYGEVKLDPIVEGEQPYPHNFTITFTGSKANLADANNQQERLTLSYNDTKNGGGIKGSTDGGNTYVEMPGLSVGSIPAGSIQASLNMLWQRGVPYEPGDANANPPIAPTNNYNNWNGYEYYRDQLNTLAAGFADVFNNINISGTSPKDDTWYLLANKEDNKNAGITAANIGLNSNWVSGAVHVSMAGENQNDTVLHMMEAMVTTYPFSKKADGSAPTQGTAAMGTANPNLKNNTFADFMNNVSTTLATDSYTNSYNLKNNVTVLNAIESSRDAVSGVSMDEEASNMMMFQSAYNAASRLMTALDEVLNTLISSTGVCGR